MILSLLWDIGIPAVPSNGNWIGYLVFDQIFKNDHTLHLKNQNLFLIKIGGNLNHVTVMWQWILWLVSFSYCLANDNKRHKMHNSGVIFCFPRMAQLLVMSAQCCINVKWHQNAEQSVTVYDWVKLTHSRWIVARSVTYSWASLLRAINP